MVGGYVNHPIAGSDSIHLSWKLKCTLFINSIFSTCLKKDIIVLNVTRSQFVLSKA